MKPVNKYPGSKWRIAKQIVELIPPHRSYLEPFFGSGAVLFNKPPSPIETINDLDDDVVNLFRCIQTNEKELARLVATTPFARASYNESFSYNALDNAYMKALHFLIRCNQGHGFRTTGEKVGWKNDIQGRNKAYALKNWCELPEVILNTAERLKLVQVDQRPAIEIISRFNFENVFMYLDPPYVFESRSDKRGQYNHEMYDRDQIELLETIKNSKAMIMISGYENDLYGEYLSNWYVQEFMSNDNTGKRRKEVVWMNYEPPTQIKFDFDGGMIE